MNYISADLPEISAQLLPLTYTRPVAALRVGIFTLAEKWEYYLGQPVYHAVSPLLEPLFPAHKAELNIVFAGNICATKELAAAVATLTPGQALVQGTGVLAVHVPAASVSTDLQGLAKDLEKISYTEPVRYVTNPCDIFAFAGAEIRADFEFLKSTKKNYGVSDLHTIVYNPENVFVEEGARIYAAVINASDGPVYIGRNTEIQEGSLIRGPFALCEGSVINMGAKMRSDTVIGPYCKVGGEISNSVLTGYSNKAHDGFLGNSVLGEWCNLGADTNTSNLKNNYSDVKLWNYASRSFQSTGRLFCGLIMGDHSKAGINTMFNTGTSVGVGCNVFGSGFPAKHIPGFRWGGPDTGYEEHKLSQFLSTEAKVMARRKLSLSHEYTRLLTELHRQSLLHAPIEDAG